MDTYSIDSMTKELMESFQKNIITKYKFYNDMEKKIVQMASSSSNPRIDGLGFST